MCVDLCQSNIIGGGFRFGCDRRKKFTHDCLLVTMPGEKRDQLHMHVYVAGDSRNSIPKNSFPLPDSRTSQIVSAFGRLLTDEACKAVIAQEYEHTRFDQLVRLGRTHGVPVFGSFQGGDRPRQ
jgi:hypothetical protein